MCGAAVDALTSDIQVAGSVVGLIIGYGVLVSLATVALNRRFRDQVTNGIALTEQREIISLLLRDFEESSSDWLWQTDADGRLIDVSDRVAEALGRTREALEGCDLVACWDHRATDQPVTREAWLRLKAVLAQPAAFRDLVLPLSVAGSARWLSLTGKPIHDRDGKFLGFRGVGADITAARQSEARIRHLAANDSLTDLPNRATLTEALRHACDSGAPFALLCVDLDEFKTVNDTLGHAAGDALLVAATQRMLHCLRSGDILARLGGDEFALLQPGGDAASAERLGRRLVEHLSEPFSLDGVPAAVGASVGAALAPTDGSTPDARMKAADLALYRAKHDGRGTLRFFQTEMSHSAQARSAMQADLRQALGRGQLSLHYQPVLDLAGERIVVMEALLRWHHPVLGAISPVEFVPLAEEGGLIVAIGTWALREACMAAAGWRQPARVAVNLSPVQVRDPGLLDTVDAALAAAGLPPSRLELEITESLFLEATDATRTCLHALRARGIRIALDDFGTGYSSLSYLRSFPFDKVKIDRSFVRDIGADGSAAAIVQAITAMAASLGMTTTAEGIETLDQEAVLRARGCAQAQGFLYSRPLPAEAAARLLSGEAVAAA
jgi:diguanylate cyclase (GGDEF)-like protein/PAS domain S-box-containing protein